MELKVKQIQRVDGVKEAFYLPAIFNGFRGIKILVNSFLGQKKKQ